jgi:hypothetical protein
MSVFAASVPFPSAPLTERAKQDLRPAAGGAAVDGGAVLPNVNDLYSGAAPDLGANELGTALYSFGPGGSSGGGGGVPAGGGGGGHGRCGLLGIEAALLFFLRRRGW